MSEPMTTAHIETVETADGGHEVRDWVEVADAQAGDDR